MAELPRLIDALSISAEDKARIFEGNAKRVFGRLEAQLKKQRK